MLSTYRHLPGSDRSVQEIAQSTAASSQNVWACHCCILWALPDHVPLQYCETGTVRNNQTSQLFSLLHKALRKKSSYRRKREEYFETSSALHISLSVHASVLHVCDTSRGGTNSKPSWNQTKSSNSKLCRDTISWMQSVSLNSFNPEDICGPPSSLMVSSFGR